MKLPIYTTTQIQDYLDGGTTKPFLAQVTDGRSIVGTFVVKTFTARDLQQHCYIGAEACSNILASQFNLAVPEAAFIQVSKQSLKALRNSNEPMYNALIKKNPSFCFGTRHLSSPMLSPAYFKNLNDTDIENIYGFDNLVLNNDRKADKPNILMSENSPILIDHERTFCPINMNFIQEGNLLPGCSHNHLLKATLNRRINGKDVRSLFTPFQAYLSQLDTSPIETIKDQLTENGVNTDGMGDWEEYMVYIKKNVCNFVTLLQNSIC